MRLANCRPKGDRSPGQVSAPADLATAVAKGDTADACAALRCYPQGTKVLFAVQDGAPLKPGKINWHSKAGEHCLATAPQYPSFLPVEDLRGVHQVESVMVHRC